MTTTYDYIVLNRSGNTYFGAIASKFAYRLKVPKVFRLTDTETHYVFEVMTDETIVLRAGQDSREGAEQYMGPNRVMVWREGVA